MSELEKRIRLSDNRILIYRVEEGFVKPTYTITEGFLENKDVKKSYILSQWDDYGFNGWTKDDDVKSILFEFDKNHPLYMPLFHLLNYDDQLIIDDDTTRELNKKYLVIYRKDNKIIIEFVDNINYEYALNYTEKFNVFIKNILPDGRSKIDQYYLDTKLRLMEFFNELNEEFTNNYHQVSMEEAFIRTSDDKEVETLKKVFKKEYKSKMI